MFMERIGQGDDDTGEIWTRCHNGKLSTFE